MDPASALGPGETSMKDERIDRLKAVPLFAGLSDRDLRHVLAVAKEVHHPDGHVVVEEDKTAVGFHLILDGDAAVTIGGMGVSTAKPGDYFGEMSIIDGKPRSATVTANGDLTTLAIPAWDFERLMQAHPSIMRGLLVELSGRIRKIDSHRA
jgi:CRP/FNR family transcriptional regulator, cyclic AMP receptor protein